MDTFIDRLAEKLNAQEIINANRAADTEELIRLKNQLKEYEKCLDQLGKIDQSIRASLADMNQEYQDKTRTLSQTMQLMAEDNSRKLEEQIQQLSQAAVRRINETGMNPSQIDRLVVESLDKIREFSMDQEALERLQQSVEEGQRAIEQGQQAMEQLQKTVEQQAVSANEFVHRENVKVYRNVQAVVTEESARQTESLSNLAGSLEEWKEQEAAARPKGGLIKGILFVSVAAMLVSAGSLVFQLLVYFHIL